MQELDFIHFLGIGAYSNPELENTSAYFMNGSDFVLLDCGETVFSCVKKMIDKDEVKRVVVLVTHLHNDHAGSLGTLISYCAYAIGKPVEVYHPVDALQKYLDIVGINRDVYTFHKEKPDSWNFSIVPYEVEHANDMKCFGYEIEVNGVSFYFSGDTNVLVDEVRKRFLENRIKFLFHEVTLDEKSDFHCRVSTLEKNIPVSERGRVFCMHLSNKNDIDVLKEKGFNIPSI